MQMLAALAVVALGALALHGQTNLHRCRQRRRIGARIEGVARRFATRAADPLARPESGDALAGGVVPPFALADLGGVGVTLDALLVLTEPRCGPCHELFPDIGGWQRVYGDRLKITLKLARGPAPAAAG
jgi:hypothetical protein